LRLTGDCATGQVVLHPIRGNAKVIRGNRVDDPFVDPAAVVYGIRVIVQIVGNLRRQLEVKDANGREWRQSLHDHPLEWDLRYELG
jgi:hypothetical protein